MKRWMLITIAVITVGITVTAFAFKDSKENTSTLYFFEFTGSDQMDQGSYTKVSPQPSPGNVCQGSNVLCGIWAQEDGSDPLRPLQTDIDALKAAYDQNNDDEFDQEQINEVDFRQ